MYRCFCRCGTLLAVVAGSTFFSAQLSGQQHLIDGAEGDISRVIQLRNKIEETIEPVAEITSRSVKLADNPLAAEMKEAVASIRETTQNLASPSVAFDEIDSSPIEGQFINGPAVGTSPRIASMPTVTTRPQIQRSQSQFQSQPQNIAPAVPAQLTGYKRTATTPRSMAPVRRSESTPVVTTQISAPEFVNVGEIAPVRIDVRNPGKTTLYNVRLIASIPAGASATSGSGQISDGECSFEIDSIEPGESRQFAMDLIQSKKQSLNIETKLVMSDRNTISVGVRQPELMVSVEGPAQANIGSNATHQITITNAGDGVARDVRLQANFPEALRFVRQSGMDAPKTLQPGQKMQVTVVSTPMTPGETGLTFTAEGIGCEADAADANLRVTQPELRIAAAGPDMNFVQRDGIYSITVDNPGEVEISNVVVQLDIPEGIKVTTISRQAKMDARTGTLTWTFDSIPAQAEQTIQLKTIASTEGEKVCLIRVSSDETEDKEVALKTIIATRADLSIQMKNIGGPVQVGSEADFVVMIENRGSNIASDMEIEILLPAGMRPSSPEEGVVDQNANSILFSDSDLKPGKVREFRFTATGVEKGEHIVRSSLRSGSSQQRVIVENSVYVYEPVQARVSERVSPAIPR